MRLEVARHAQQRLPEPQTPERVHRLERVIEELPVVRDAGEPWHRVERLQNIVGWFDHWLMGVPKPEYEVAQQEEVPVRKGNAPAKQPTRP